MEMSLLFESFMVSYLLAVLFYSMIAIWYCKQDQQDPTPKIESRIPSGPTAAQVMAMYKVKKEIKRQQG